MIKERKQIAIATLEDLERELWLRVRESGELVWITKDGNVIPIKEMSNTHLWNTIKMLYRNPKAEEDYLEALGSIFYTLKI
jgi:hypothetical protein